MKIANKISLSFLATAIILTAIGGFVFLRVAEDSLKQEVVAHFETTAHSREGHAESYEPVKRLWVVFIFILIVIPIAAYIMGRVVTRRITEPIHRLHKGTEIIAEGNLAYRVGTPAKDEIGQLSRAFDTMTSELKKKIVSMDDLNKEIAERIKMQQQLAQSQTMAALGRFSAGASHEIKNPLGIILGGMEYLRAKYHDADEESKETMEMVSNAVLRVDSIINALNELAGPSEHRVRKVDAKTMVDDAIFSFKSKFKDRQIGFSATAEDGLFIEVDIDHMQYALLSILTNAADALPAGGEVKITVRKELPATCVIEIADTGEGISEETMPKIFEPFFTTRRDRKQIGLGLTVAQEFIKLNKGDISIASKKGKGTVVKIAFPLAT